MTPFQFLDFLMIVFVSFVVIAVWAAIIFAIISTWMLYPVASAQLLVLAILVFGKSECSE